MKKAFLIVFASLLFFSFFTPVQTQAQDFLPLVQCELTGQNRCTFCDFFKMLDRIIDFLLLRIVPAMAAIMIAIGGFMYIISQGSPDKLNRIKSLFTGVAIGLLIVYGAWLLVDLFLMTIGAASWQGFGDGWWIINCDTSGSSPGGSSGGKIEETIKDVEETVKDVEDTIKEIKEVSPYDFYDNLPSIPSDNIPDPKDIDL